MGGVDDRLRQRALRRAEEPWLLACDRGQRVGLLVDLGGDDVGRPAVEVEVVVGGVIAQRVALRELFTRSGLRRVA